MNRDAAAHRTGVSEPHPGHETAVHRTGVSEPHPGRETAVHRTGVSEPPVPRPAHPRLYPSTRHPLQ
jgi:hypothetical protein